MTRREDRKNVSPTEPAHEEMARDWPLEDAQKSYHTILEQHVQQAKEELDRPTLALLISSFSAGLDLGFGPGLMAVIATLAQGDLSPTVTKLLVATAYATGFIFVVIGRSALFTEQTTSAVLPVLTRRARVPRLLRLWGVVLAGNLVGAAVIAAVIAFLGPQMAIMDVAVMGDIAAGLLQVPWWTILLSAIVAGWLMGLLSWLVMASRDTISQIGVVLLTTFVIGVAGFHHSIAGTIEVLMAVFAGAGPTLGDYGVFILWSVAGNALGGAVFVAILKFGHVRAGASRTERRGSRWPSSS